MENNNKTNQNNNTQEVSELDQIVARKNKLQTYKDLGLDPFGQAFKVTAHAQEIHTKYSHLKNEEVDTSKIFSLAGRVVLKRSFGKLGFIQLKDKTGKIQLYISKNDLSEADFNLFKLCDLGDIIGVKGYPMRTTTGELSIKTTNFYHLSKALRPLPDKFHGLSDIEIRSRKRYLDLIVNDQSLKTAFARPKIIRGIQSFLDKLGYVEVETPCLSPILGGASARPFITHHNTLDQDFYLRIATELPLKRLLVGGMERVYEIGRLFRNEGMDNSHNPEFTTVELYQAYGELKDMMDIAEKMIRKLALDVNNSLKLTWMGQEIDLAPKFKRASMVDLIKEKTGIDFKKVKTDKKAFELAKEHDIYIEKHFTYGHIVNAFFEKYVEETLVQPTFVTGHPIEISPLTKKDLKDPRFTQRFELYINCKEIANAYTELNDPIDQKERFIEQLKEKDKGNIEANDMDNDFIEALEYGMPPAGGMGIGIDRLVMFLTGNDSIREVILFPTLKSVKD